MKILSAVDTPVPTKGINDIFGKVTPQGPFTNNNPIQDFSNLITFFVKMAIVGAGLLMLVYLLWGAIDWISSGGEKEKLTKAQNKITNAILGLVVLIAVFVIFGLLTGNVLGIITNTGNGWTFNLPSL